MVGVPSLGMTSGQIALRILRGRDRADEADRGHGHRHRGGLENRADKALATIMRIIVNANGTEIKGANQRTSLSYGAGWSLAIQGSVATGDGSVSVEGANATGAGKITLSSIMVSGALGRDDRASDLLASAKARGAVSLDAAGVSVLAAGMGNVEVHVEQHSRSSGADSSSFRDVYAEGQGGVSMSVMAFPSDDPLRVNGGDGSDAISVIAGKLTGVYGEGGDDAIAVTSLSSAYDAIDNVDGGDGNDAIAISSRGGVARVNGGDGNDAIAVAAAGKVDIIEGGDGNDSIAVSADSVSGIYAGDGNDTISISSRHDAGGVKGGEGNDTISLSAEEVVGYVQGGDGNDVIVATAAEVRRLSGGDGNDVIKARGGQIDGISGGKGDDLIVLDSTKGKASTVFFGEGDGNDVIETNGPLEIRRVSDDGTKTLDMSKAAVTRNDDGTATIRFEGSNDTITVRFSGKMAAGDFTVQQDKDRLIIGPAAA